MRAAPDAASKVVPGGSRIGMSSLNAGRLSFAARFSSNTAPATPAALLHQREVTNNDLSCKQVSNSVSAGQKLIQLAGRKLIHPGRCLLRLLWLYWQGLVVNEGRGFVGA